MGLQPKSHQTADGVRQVSVVVVLNQQEDRVLVVSSRKHKDRWVLPKGGWDEGGESRIDAGVREVWEEGGVVVKPSRHLITLLDSKLSKKRPVPKAEYAFYEMTTVKIEPTWPEAHERRREWVTYEQALERLEWRGPEFIQGLEHCSLSRRGIQRTVQG